MKKSTPKNLEYCQLGNPRDTQGAILTKCAVLKKTWESYGTRMGYIIVSLNGTLHLGRAALAMSQDFPGTKIYCTDLRPESYLLGTLGPEAADLFKAYLNAEPKTAEYLKKLKPEKVKRS